MIESASDVRLILEDTDKFNLKFRMDPQISWTKKGNFLDRNDFVATPQIVKIVRPPERWFLRPNDLRIHTKKYQRKCGTKKIV